jgi:hypothetical protein
MKIPVHIVGTHETRNVRRIQTLGHEGDGLVIYDDARCYLDLELPDGSVTKVEVTSTILDRIYQASKEYLSKEGDPLNQQSPTRFERILQGE